MAVKAWTWTPDGAGHSSAPTPALNRTLRLGFLTVFTLAVLCIISTPQFRLCKPALFRPPGSDPPLPSLERSRSKQPKLHGKFLHITDLHLDDFYKPHSEIDNCHHGHGPAGVFGTPAEGCDSPLVLLEQTFEWIKSHIANDIDFVIWTGDSARHDNDEHIPRSESQIISQNIKVVSLFAETFGAAGKKQGGVEYTIPIVPNIGNNDILPHNILLPGPNVWTETYLKTWRQFIPEEQRHSFQRGGWFSVEVIPSKLTVFSINTMFFFASNSAVDGCAMPSEPGYEQFEWLRVQLQIVRERGMKAILIGHVPPARTSSKTSWEETCWQKFSLWQHQFRDIIVSSHFGHMNLDHFILQDFRHILPDARRGRLRHDIDDSDAREVLPHDCSLWPRSASSYLVDLRKDWAHLPSFEKSCKAPNSHACVSEMGGPFAEGFGLTLVSPSVIPTYFPSLRLFEYNITGLESKSDSERPGKWWNRMMSPFINRRGGESAAQAYHLSPQPDVNHFSVAEAGAESQSVIADYVKSEDGEEGAEGRKKKKKHGKGRKRRKGKKTKKPKKFRFTVPAPPPASSLPGPAYYPQPLSLTGYHQYFANISRPNELCDDDSPEDGGGGGSGNNCPQANVTYELEYSTFVDPIFRLSDFTVRSYLKLAHRVASREEPGTESYGADPTLIADPQSKPSSPDHPHRKPLLPFDTQMATDAASTHGKHRKNKEKADKLWLYFVQRALVSTLSRDKLRDKFL